MAERGLEHARFTDLAATTGLAVSSLQYAFGSRDDLIYAVVEHALQEDLDRLQSVLVQVADPRERLERLLALALSGDTGARERHTIWIEVAHAAVRDLDLRDLHRRRGQAWLQAWNETIARGTEARQFFIPASSYDAAVDILALTDGLITRIVLEDADIDPARALSLAREAVMALLGLGSRQAETA